MKYYDLDNIPAFVNGVVPFTLQYQERKRGWVPYAREGFGHRAVEIDEKKFREMAGEFADQVDDAIKAFLTPHKRIDAGYAS